MGWNGIVHASNISFVPAAGIMKAPAAHYTDPKLFEVEPRRIFGCCRR